MIPLGTGLLIASDQPQELAKFYGLILGAEIVKGFNENHFSVICNNLCKLQIYRPVKDKFLLNRPQSAVAIYFEKEASSNPLIDLEEWCKNIIPYGGTVINGPSNESFGAEAWISDPEGNNFLIVIPLDSLDV